MKITFAGRKQAGLIGLLTLCLFGKVYNSDTYKSINHPKFKKLMKESDVFFNVHGREILTKKHLFLPRLGCYNVHPYFHRFKGADPVGRMLESGIRNGKISVHKMTSKVDEGEILAEMPICPDGNSKEEVYNNLYYYYFAVILLAISKLGKLGGLKWKEF